MIRITPRCGFWSRSIRSISGAGSTAWLDCVSNVLDSGPFAGWLFVFRNRRATAIKILTYDSQGFWLAHKRLSRGRFRWWPPESSEAAARLDAHQLRLINGRRSGRS